MGLLFCSVMGGGISNQFLAVWHAISNDRAQRGMLEAAAREPLRLGQDLWDIISNEVHWINVEATKIEDIRNDALHSPLWGYQRGEKETIIIPVAGLGHRRAKKLQEAKRGLLAEFRYCRDAALILTDYVKDIEEFLGARGPRTWPERPSLPNRGKTNRC